MALLASVLAFQQRTKASDRADEASVASAEAETRRMVSDAGQLALTNRRVALLLAAEAHRRDPGTASLGALQVVLSTTSNFLGLVGSGYDFVDIAWTPNGSIVGVHDSGVVELTTAGEVVQSIEFPGATKVEVHPDGAVIAVASDSTVRFFELASGDQMFAAQAHDSFVTAMSFSGDGSRFATGDRAGVIRVFNEGFEFISRLDAHPVANDGTQCGTVSKALPHDPFSVRPGVVDLSLSFDGQRIASVGDTTARLWMTGIDEPLFDECVTRLDDLGALTQTSAVGVGFVSHDDEQTIAVATLASVNLLADSGEVIDRRSLRTGLGNILSGGEAAFADDLVAVVFDAGRVQLAWQGDEGELRSLATQLSGSLSIAVDSGGDRLIAGGKGGAVLLSLRGSGLISRSLAATGDVDWFVSNDGLTLIGSTTTESDEPGLWQWSGTSFDEAVMPGPDSDFAFTGLPNALSFNFDELVVYERDPNTLEVIGPPIVTASVTSPVFSHDGRWFAIGNVVRDGDPSVVIYDRSSGDIVAELAGLDGSAVRSTTFSPDDSRFVAATDSGQALVFDTSTWQEISPRLSAGGGAVVQAQFTPDGKYLVTLSSDGRFLVRDAGSLQPGGAPMLGNTNAVQGFSLGPMFSDDGKWMVSTADGKLRVWDLNSRSLVGSPFPSDFGVILYAARNARWAVTGVDDRIVVWDLDLDTWPDIACRAAGRNMTIDEWNQFGPAGEPYQQTCPQWPSLAENDQRSGDSE